MPDDGNGSPAKAPPAPAGASTPPPEGAHKTDEYRVTSLAPSMELTNNYPVPYGITAVAEHDMLYSPNVNYRGTAAMRLSSRIANNTGDEAANGRKGVVSGAQGGLAAPITASRIVRINGSPAIRHGDRFEMDKAAPDAPGNTVGEGRLIRNVEVVAAPPDERSWWQKAKDGVSSAAKSVGDFDAAHGHVLTRSVGAVQAVGGGFEAVVGGAGAIVFSETGIGALAGAAVAWNGVDNFQAGLRTAWTGEGTRTVTQTVVGAGVRAAGGSETAAAVAEGVAGLGPGGVGSLASVPGRLARIGRAAEDVPTVARAAEEAGAAATTVEQAAVEGSAGVRVTRALSLREKYLGRTPGKASATGRKVIERMEAEGKIQTNPRTGLQEFQSSDGNWYDLSKGDMAHQTDAVTWWNQTGRAYGAKAPEVRAWMLNSDNYVLESSSINRSQGAILGQSERYLPPLR